MICSITSVRRIKEMICSITSVRRIKEMICSITCVRRRLKEMICKGKSIWPWITQSRSVALYMMGYSDIVRVGVSIKVMHWKDKNPYITCITVITYISLYKLKSLRYAICFNSLGYFSILYFILHTFMVLNFLYFFKSYKHFLLHFLFIFIM